MDPSTIPLIVHTEAGIEPAYPIIQVVGNESEGYMICGCRSDMATDFVIDKEDSPGDNGNLERTSILQPKAFFHVNMGESIVKPGRKPKYPRISAHVHKHRLDANAILAAVAAGLAGRTHKEVKNDASVEPRPLLSIIIENCTAQSMSSPQFIVADN